MCQFKWQCLGLVLGDGKVFRTSTDPKDVVVCGDGNDVAGKCSLCYAFVSASLLFRLAQEACVTSETRE